MGDLCLHVRERRNQSLQRGNGIGRQVTVWLLNDRDQPCDVGRAPRHDLTELGQMAT